LFFQAACLGVHIKKLYNSIFYNNATLIDKHMTQSIFLPDESATLAMGTQWARCVAAPLVIYLNGDLGMGKTTFVRGLLRGLGYQGAVKSPTYAIVESYRLPEYELNHFDLYRFSYPEEWQDAGLDDFFSGNHVNLIEWAVQGGEFVPAPDLVITFSMQNGGRLCTVAAHSASGQRSLNLWQN
jgi:hypothetical protein